MPKRYIPIFVLLLPLVFLGTSCEPTFEPLRQNHQFYFSMNGYLDAEADTQWVRIMPVRNTLFFKPKPIDATVTLEEVGSGQSVTMNDSLFSYVQGMYAYNFWTTMEIQPEHTYRITATGSDGKTSYVVTTIPENFPGPLVDIIYYYPPRTPEPPIPDKASIVIPGVERVADLRSIYTSQDRLSTIAFPHLQDSVDLHSGEPGFVVNMRKDFEDAVTFLPVPNDISERTYLNSSIIKEYIYVAVASSGYEVNSTKNPPPDGVSNVENGVGYVAGIISKTVPFRSCYAEDGLTLKPCPTVQISW